MDTGLIKEHSSLVLKGISVHGGVGGGAVIDSDYQVEIWVILQNKGKDEKDLLANEG